MTEPTPHVEGQVPRPPSKKHLLIYTGGALVVGVLIVCGAILPAEYNADPLSLGKLTGLNRLWAPPEVSVSPTEGYQPLARAYPTPFRTDEFVIKLDSVDKPEGLSELEFKLAMTKGSTYVYSWVAEGIDLPQEFLAEFHGHTVPGPGEKMVVSTYLRTQGERANGAVIAPFDGIHGWYYKNDSAVEVRVRLRVSGFYTLIPPGQEGNLARIRSEAELAAAASKPQPTIPEVLN